MIYFTPGYLWPLWSIHRYSYPDSQRDAIYHEHPGATDLPNEAFNLGCCVGCREWSPTKVWNRGKGQLIYVMMVKIKELRERMCPHTSLISSLQIFMTPVLYCLSFVHVTYFCHFHCALRTNGTPKYSIITNKCLNGHDDLFQIKYLGADEIVTTDNSDSPSYSYRTASRDLSGLEFDPIELESHIVEDTKQAVLMTWRTIGGIEKEVKVKVAHLCDHLWLKHQVDIQLLATPLLAEATDPIKVRQIIKMNRFRIFPYP